MSFYLLSNQVSFFKSSFRSVYDHRDEGESSASTVKELNQFFSQEPALFTFHRLKLLWQNLTHLLAEVEDSSDSEENEEKEQETKETTRQVIRLLLNLLNYLKKTKSVKNRKEIEEYLENLLEKQTILTQDLVKLLQQLKLHNKRTLISKLFSFLEELECLMDDFLFFLLLFSLVLSPSPVLALSFGEKSFNLLANWVINPNPLRNRAEQKKDFSANVLSNPPLLNQERKNSLGMHHALSFDNTLKPTINWATLFAPQNIIKKIQLNPSEVPRPVQENKSTPSYRKK